MRKRTTLYTAFLPAALLAVAALWAAQAAATPSLYTASCTACHSPTVNTCNGCHAHGTHSSSAKTNINVSGTLNKTSYAPGETVSVTVTGGYRTGWVRVLLFDGAGTELARSSCPGGLGGCTTSSFPQTLTAPAPTTPGTYTWAAAWYGNQFDESGASFGSGNSATIRAGFFTPDSGNPGHGYQTVALPAFTVAAPAAPSISLSPASLTFPTVTLGGSAQQTAQVQNVGNAPLSVTSISRCPGTSMVFTWSPAAPLTVPAGGSTTLTVTYTPLAAGTDTGCLAIASNDAANPTVNLALTGSAVAPSAPAIALVPPSLAFGSVMVGGSGTLTTQVQNTGTATLDVSAIARCAGTSAEFAWNPAAPFSVAPGETTALTVTYAPANVGADSGCLALTSNAASSPTQLAVSGTGTAIPAPAIALDPAAVDFGAVLLGSMGTLPVQVRNTGTAALSVTAIDRCSGTSTAFGWAPAAPFGVPPGDSVTLQVSFAPVLTGAETGCLAVSSNDPDQPTVELGLAGEGVTEATPSIALVPSSLDFGAVTLGGTATRTTEIQNAGAAPLQVTEIARCDGTSEAFAWSPAAPFTIGAGMTSALTVTYAPTAAGTDTGCLAVSSDDPANPTVQLGVTGTGVEEPVAGLDIDLGRLILPRKVETSQPREITPRILAKNRAFVDGTAVTTLVGVFDGAEIYRESISITLSSGEAGAFAFPPYAVQLGAAGIVDWTATAEDEDPDVDQVTATTQLKVRGDHERRRDDDREHDDDGEHDDEAEDDGDRGRSSASTSILGPGAGAGAGGCSSGPGGALAVALLALLAAARRRRSTGA